jgi:hypothetical protein
MKMSRTAINQVNIWQIYYILKKEKAIIPSIRDTTTGIITNN